VVEGQEEEDYLRLVDEGLGIIYVHGV